MVICSIFSFTQWSLDKIRKGGSSSETDSSAPKFSNRVKKRRNKNGTILKFTFFIFCSNLAFQNELFPITDTKINPSSNLFSLFMKSPSVNLFKRYKNIKKFRLTIQKNEL